MELSLESAFSTGGLVGHASYVLLVLSMMMRRITVLRLFVIASALIAMFSQVIWLKDPVGVFWEAMLVLVNVVQLLIVYFENRLAQFSPEETAFCEKRLGNLDRADCRRLLNKGLWVTGQAGAVLTCEGEAVSHLIYLASGEVEIQSGGKTVAKCAPGAFIGELTVMDGEPATGTSFVGQEARYWMIEAGVLRKLVHDRPDIGQTLQRGFTLNLKEKLVQSNRIITEAAAQ
jgi:hypothetical protein